MPRRERPLDHDGTGLAHFAAGLRELRAKADSPTYRELGQRAHYSASTLSDAAGGRKLPTLPVTLGYVRACGGDVEAWTQRWRDAAARMPQRAEDAGSDGDERSPYVGLAAFQPHDADRFFGRERLVQDLLDRLAGRRLMAVFGPSGTGKSSLLRAGLIPRLTTEHVLFTPGAHPLCEYASQLAEFLGASPPQLLADLRANPSATVDRAMQNTTAEFVIVIDQFEECFTVCTEPAERDAFLTALIHLAAHTDGRARVVLGVRADFYQHCAYHPELADALTDAHILVGPMHPDELRDAIVRPAAAAECAVDTALVARLVADAAGQPAALPLLSHALLETWRRRSGMRLTLDGYERTGGIEHALARTAEATYNSLTSAQQETLRHVCRRLVAYDTGPEVTKRRVPRGELGDSTATTEVLDRLSAARLLSLDRDSVDLAHEALLRHWPRLRDWLAEDREGLQIHRRLTRTADEWHNFDRDPAILYRGARLDNALAWRGENTAALNTTESAFLDAATALRAEEKHLERRRLRHRRRLVTLLATMVLLIAAATSYGLYTRHIAAQQLQLATSQRMVGEGRGFLTTDAAEAGRLGLAAYLLAPTDEARDLILSAAAMPDRIRFPDTINRMRDVALSSDGHLVALAEATAVQLWDLDLYHKLATIPGDVTEQPAISISSSGRWLTVSRPYGVVDLFDLKDPKDPLRVASVPALAASVDPAGTVLAVWGYGQATRLLAIDHGALREIAQLPETDGLKFCSDGRTVFVYRNEVPAGSVEVWAYDSNHAVARKVTTWTAIDNPILASSDGLTVSIDTRADEKLRLWDTRNVLEPRELPSLPLSPSSFQGAVFNINAHTLAVTDRSATLRVIDLTDTQHPHLETTLAGHTSMIRAVTFAPDGRLLSAGLDATVRPWNLDLASVMAHLHP